VTQLFAAALPVLLLASTACKPWTVRPLQERSSQSSSAGASFDAHAYVSSIWTAKVLAAAEASAIDIHSLALPRDGSTERARRSVLVSGTARVTEVDLKSRVGLAYLDIAGQPDSRVALQVGPVLRGTALRDALPFVKFSDFVNQIDFAAVASELNARALASALRGLDLAGLKGKTVSFRGATAVNPGASAVIEIVPIAVRIEGSAP
jgi:predicted lipoprotein